MTQSNNFNTPKKPSIKQDMARKYTTTKSMNAILADEHQFIEQVADIQEPPQELSDPLYSYHPDQETPGPEDEQSYIQAAEDELFDSEQLQQRSLSPEIEDYPTLNWDSYNQDEDEEDIYSDDDNIHYQLCLISLTDEAQLKIDSTLDSTINETGIPGLGQDQGYQNDAQGFTPARSTRTRSQAKGPDSTSGAIPTVKMSLSIGHVSSMEDTISCRAIVDNTLSHYNMINPLILNGFAEPILLCQDYPVSCKLPFTNTEWRSSESIVLFIRFHPTERAMPIKFYVMPELNTLPCILGNLSIIAELMQLAYNVTCNPIAPTWARRPLHLFDFHAIIKADEEFIQIPATIDLGSTTCRIHPEFLAKRRSLQSNTHWLDEDDESIFCNSAAEYKPIEQFVCLPIAIMSCTEPDNPNGKFVMSEYYNIVFLVDPHMPNPRNIIINYVTAVYMNIIHPKHDHLIELRSVDATNPYELDTPFL
jgi:hypothetical protein